MTIKNVLLSIVNYPVPALAIDNIADARGLALDDDITSEIRVSDAFRLATADIYRYAAFAPNVSEGGVSVDMLYSDRKDLREKANLIYKELGDPLYENGIRQTFTFLGDDI